MYIEPALGNLVQKLMQWVQAVKQPFVSDPNCIRIRLYLDSYQLLESMVAGALRATVTRRLEPATGKHGRWEGSNSGASLHRGSQRPRRRCRCFFI
jgi:hypothetical protein